MEGSGHDTLSGSVGSECKLSRVRTGADAVSLLSGGLQQSVTSLFDQVIHV